MMILIKVSDTGQVESISRTIVEHVLRWLFNHGCFDLQSSKLEGDEWEGREGNFHKCYVGFSLRYLCALKIKMKAVAEFGGL